MVDLRDDVIYRSELVGDVIAEAVVVVVITTRQGKAKRMRDIALSDVGANISMYQGKSGRGTY